MRGSIIFASMYIGGGLGMRFDPTFRWVRCCLFWQCAEWIMQFDILKPLFLFQCFGFPHAFERGYLAFFAWSYHRPTFFVVYWFIVLFVGLCYFHVIVFFLYICRVCSSIYKICISWVDYFYWWNLHDSRFVDGRLLWRFLFPLAALSLEHCFARPFRLPAQVELTCRMSTIVTGLDSTRFPLHRKR